jgi:hypothetical protein
MAPVKMIFLVFVIDAVLCCLPLGSSTAFAAITGVTTVGYQISYAIPILMRLTASKNTFVQTPSFDLGRFSMVIGWMSAVWLVGPSCLFFFPVSFDENMHQTQQGFNYTCVVVGATLMLALTY